MIHFTYKVTNPVGMHARPAAEITSIAEKFDSKITVGRDNQKLSGKSLMGMIALKAYHGTELEVWIEGPDEEEAAQAMREAFDYYLGDGKIKPAKHYRRQNADRQ